MATSERTSGSVPSPLQAIQDDLKRRQREAAIQADRLARRQQLDNNLALRFKELISLACSFLALDDRFQRQTIFMSLARSLLAFNEALRGVDQEYPRYRIRERLERATRTGVPALDTAASLLLLDPSADAEALARTLEEFRETPPHHLWPTWLTYIIDQLVNSHGPPTKDSVPPDTTREEWRQAELAFGCILFSDDAFGVAQACVDRAAGLIDDARTCAGHLVPHRPPGRVRHLIARVDPRALQWYCCESPPLPPLQPPPSIEAITEPASLRRQLDEVWTAANCLQIALDKWTAWFVELGEKGDAHPAIALNCQEIARRAIRALLTNRPRVQPFDSDDETSLQAMLPPIPAWDMGGIDDALPDNGENAGSKSRVRWQEDRTFLDRYYRPPDRLYQKAGKLRSATAQLIDLLESLPMTALLGSSMIPMKEDGAARPITEVAPASSPVSSPSLKATAYLLGWKEILDCLNLKMPKKRLVERLNKEYDGPIMSGRKGGRPKVNRDKLLAWWNGLEDRFGESEGKQADREATVQAQHPYGRNEMVVPNMSGHVKKRRKKK